MKNKLYNIIEKYFPGSPAHFFKDVLTLFESDKIKTYMKQKYKEKHSIQTDKQLYRYVNQLKNQYIKKSDPIHKIIYDSSIVLKKQALGIHAFKIKPHGRKTIRKNEIKISSTFKKMPLAFLEHIVVHELAHVKEKEHNKAFYRLCNNMQPAYHEVEVDLRLFLIYKDLGLEDIW